MVGGKWCVPHACARAGQLLFCAPAATPVHRREMSAVSGMLTSIPTERMCPRTAFATVQPEALDV